MGTVSHTVTDAAFPATLLMGATLPATHPPTNITTQLRCHYIGRGTQPSKSPGIE